MKTDVLIIGAGLNGLVAGAWLARQKLSVAIVDRAPVAGGAAATTEIAPGFHAPAYSHALGPVHADVLRALDLGAGIEFITPDPALTAIGADGVSIAFHRDPVAMAAAIHRVSPADVTRWRGFLEITGRLAGVVAEIQRRPPPAIDGRPLAEWWPLLGAGRRARALGRRDLAQLARWFTMPVADIVAEWMDHDLLRAAVAARAILGNFAGPRSAGTGWMLLQRLAEDPLPVGSGGTVRGGPGVLARAVADRARAAGADLRTGTAVARILVHEGRAVGVVLDNGDEIRARAVLSAIDPRRTLLDFVEPDDLAPSFRERIGHIRARGVTAKINLALSALPVLPAAAHEPAPLRGRLLFARGLDHLEQAFDAAKYGAWSPDPWLEVAVPSVTDATLAPAGAHVMSIYAHAAPRDLRGRSWSEAAPEFLGLVMRTLEAHFPGLESLVVHRELRTPADLESTLGSAHIFHGEPTLDQSWVARPLLGWAKYRTPIEGLFLASAGTHPGGGLTGLSGLLAAKAVTRVLDRN